jgi:aspartate/methionine/tyrosine aminotransferase
VTRFSHRLSWSTKPNEISRILSEKTNILDLTESNPTRAGFDYPREIVAALADPAAFLYSPSAQGLESARRAICDYYQSFHVTVEPSQVLLTASTSEAYGFLFKLLCDPGDEVLSPRPSYPLFEYLAGLENVSIRPYSLRYDGAWHIDIAELRAAITERTRAVVLVNPNNPTGSFLKQDERERLRSLCAENQISIISDEVFADFAFREDESRVSTLAGESGPLTFSLSGLSKVAGLPQLKLGWIVISGDNASAARERLELIADTYLSVSTPIQIAAPSILRLGQQIRDQIRERTAANLRWLEAALVDKPVHLLHLEGGWYATLQVPNTRSEEEWVTSLLREHEVLVQPGYFYDFEREAYLVVSLLTEPSVFREGLARLLEHVSRS